MKKRVVFNILAVTKHVLAAVLLASIGLVSYVVPIMAADAASVNVTATPEAVAKIAFTTPPRTRIINVPTHVITIQTQNTVGNPVNVMADTTINLTSTSTQGLFSLSDTPWASITSVTIPTGSNSASFYYMDTTVGNPVITASESPDQGWTDAEQEQTITDGDDEGGGGGGGGGGGAIGYTYLVEYTSPDGMFYTDVMIRSPDGKARINIPKGTKAVNQYGRAATFIIMRQITPGEDQPPPPDDIPIIGRIYRFGGLYDVIFDPPVTLTFIYLDSDVSQDTNEEEMVIAYWDAEAREWVALEDCVVDPVANIISAPLIHFSAFTILGYEVKPTAPATFEVSSLSIYPAEVESGEEVTISATITNTGGEAGSYEATLMIDDIEVATEEIIDLAPGDSQRLTFVTAKDEVATYTVTIGDLSGTFEVRSPPAAAGYTTSYRSIHLNEVGLGESMSLSVLVTNTGEATGTYEISFRLDDEVVDSRGVAVEGGTSEELTFSTEFPAELDIGQSTTLSAHVTSTSDTPSMHKIAFKVDEVVVATKHINMAGIASEKATFAITRERVETYTISIDHLPDTLVARTPPPPETNRWPIIGIIVAAIGGGLVMYFMVRRQILVREPEPTMVEPEHAMIEPEPARVEPAADKTKGIDALAATVVNSVLLSAASINDAWASLTGQAPMPSESKLTVRLEMLWFFLTMLDRFALEVCSPEARDTLKDAVVPHAIQAVIMHPLDTRRKKKGLDDKERRRNVAARGREEYREAEMDYSSCSELTRRSLEVSDEETVTGKLFVRISRRLGLEPDPDIRLFIMAAATSMLIKSGLKEQVIKACQALQ
jgi:hypothetical protein